MASERSPIEKPSFQFRNKGCGVQWGWVALRENPSIQAQVIRQTLLIAVSGKIWWSRPVDLIDIQQPFDVWLSIDACVDPSKSAFTRDGSRNPSGGNTDEYPVFIVFLRILVVNWAT